MRHSSERNEDDEMPLVLESNQNHATVEETETSPTLPAAMGMGGGHIPMVIKSYGLDSYNQEIHEEVSQTLRVNMGGDSTAKVMCLNDQGGSVMEITEDMTSTLRAQEHGHQPIVYNGENITSPINKAQPLPGDPCHTLSTDSRNYVVYENHSQDTRFKELGDVCQTVSATYGMGGNNQPLVVSASPEPLCYGNGQLGSAVCDPSKAGALNCMHDQQAVVTYGLDRASYNQGKNAKFDFSVEEEQQPTLTAKGPGAVMKSKVRRLTPEECEALQGFPRGWTIIGDPEEVELIDYEYEYDDDGNEISKTPIGTHKEIQYFYTDENGKRKRCADSARYKALGNSIAVGYANKQSGFWMWLMKRISATYERSATMGSLFDGIGGFPLAWEFYNGKGSCLWASEIEGFPIQVTKERFKEG